MLLDGGHFVAQRASYFRHLDALRAAGALIYYHDETWLGAGEEKRNIWVDDQGKGWLRKQNGQGKRIAISAMVGLEGFVEPIDVWQCDKEHAMNSERFHKWIEDAASRLRIKHGPGQPIAIIIDNASCTMYCVMMPNHHNVLGQNINSNNGSLEKVLHGMPKCPRPSCSNLHCQMYHQNDM